MEPDFVQTLAPLVQQACNDLDVVAYFPNQGVEQPAERHARIRLMPTTPQDMGICSAITRYTWLVQVTLCTREGTGMLAGLWFLNDLGLAFPFGQRITSINTGKVFQCVSSGGISDAYTAAGWYNQSVTFKFQSID